MTQTAKQIVYLSKQYRPRMFKPIFLPIWFSQIYRQLINIPVIYEFLYTWTLTDHKWKYYSEEYPSIIDRNRVFSILFCFVNQIGLLHYFYGSKWSSALNRVYFYQNHFTAQTLMAQNCLIIVYMPAWADWSYFFMISNFVFTVNFVYVYVFENTFMCLSDQVSVFLNQIFIILSYYYVSLNIQLGTHDQLFLVLSWKNAFVVCFDKLLCFVYC